VSLRFFTFDERPELERLKRPLLEAWPEFMFHDPVAGAFWNLLYDRFGGFQHFLFDEDTDEVVAEVNSLPVYVDLEALPDRGWDDVMERGTAALEEPTAVSAIQVMILPERQGSGLSGLCLERMRSNALNKGFAHLVAPVRPSSKALYPLVSMERYVTWTLDGSLPFDPWLRVHARLGAELVRVCPQSMTVSGTVAEWEEWTGLAFPDSGAYVVSGAVDLVTIDREADLGRYVEPNVWMHHRI
jgi:GNAT superfamily N-acetyltransferase